MKTLSAIIITLFLTINLITAQDTLYVYKSGAVISKCAVNDLDSMSFTYTPPATGTVTDIDGNLYHWITIGTQKWMVENLKTSKFRTGESISNVTDAAAWSNTTFAAWCDYNNDLANGTKYGHLYNWYAVNDSRNIAPVGWHVATDAEWTTLTNFLGNESVAGGKLKEAGTVNWFSPNSSATNESGFTGLPGGLRSYSNGTFINMGSNCYFWTSTSSDNLRAWDRELFYNQTNCFRYYFDSKFYGFSVRCIKD
jgi:uncharacterized protein (TIGR02145 family)